MRTGDTARELLEAELERRRLSVRGAAKLMAAAAGDGNLETHRRTLNRILNEDRTPREDTAALIERALEMPAGWLPRFDSRRRRAAEPRSTEIAELRAEVADLRLRLAELEKQARPDGRLTEKRS